MEKEKSDALEMAEKKIKACHEKKKAEKGNIVR